MADPGTDAAANVASRRRKMLVVSNLFMWLFSGAYVVSPVDLITDLVPLLGWTDDLLTIAIAIGFTIYTVRTLRSQGLRAFVPGAQPVADLERPQITTSKVDDTPTIVDMKVDKEGYEPISPDKIKSL